MSKQISPALPASEKGPCPTVIQIRRTPQPWKFTQHHRTNRPLTIKCQSINIFENIRKFKFTSVLLNLYINSPQYASFYIYRSLKLYRGIFGTSSYGETRTSLQVRHRHMNECRIFHNINSIAVCVCVCVFQFS